MKTITSYLPLACAALGAISVSAAPLSSQPADGWVKYGDWGWVWVQDYPWVFQDATGWAYATPGDAAETGYWLSFADGSSAYYAEGNGTWVYGDTLGTPRYWEWLQIKAALNGQVIPVEDVDALPAGGYAQPINIDSTDLDSLVLDVVYGSCGPVRLFAETTVETDSEYAHPASARMTLVDQSAWPSPWQDDSGCTEEIKQTTITFDLNSMLPFWGDGTDWSYSVIRLQLDDYSFPWSPTGQVGVIQGE